MTYRVELKEEAAQYPWLTEFVNDAFTWAGGAPENADINVYVSEAKIMADDELLGVLYLGDDMRFVPAVVVKDGS